MPRVHLRPRSDSLQSAISQQAPDKASETGRRKNLMLGDERIPEDLPLNVSGAEGAVYDDGYLRVEHDNFYVACAGKPLYNLTRKEFLILSRLVRAMGRPVTKQEIWGFAWRRDSEFNWDT